MTPTQAKDRLNTAIDTVSHALVPGNDLLSEAMFGEYPTAHVDQMVTVFVANYWYFGVHFEEIRHNTDQGLVNLVKCRLENTLCSIVDQVQMIGTYCHILHGTQPWVLVQGL